MDSFLQRLEKESKTKKPVVMAFGRMNPPTIGHEKLVNKVKQLAKDYNADHHVIISHTTNKDKNPLDPKTKLRHAKRFFPNTNIEASDKDAPTFLQHAAKLYQQGHDHLIMVAGSDRIPEYEKKLKQYNGTAKGSLYNFKKIEVKSAGQRDPDAEGAEGMSASKMREHARNNNFHEFKQGVPSHVPEKHAKELFRDVRRGMGLNESQNRGLFRAIFVTGGPGSGKDIVLREAIAESKFVEITSVQAYNYLMDKKSLSEKTNDMRKESIRNRSPLIINGPADDHSRIITIKEELEELGYSTVMVFVDTTNEISQLRNEKLTKMISESVRFEKWQLAQTSKEAYRQNFNHFINFNNNGSFDSIEEDLTDIYHNINSFIDDTEYLEEAYRWMETHGLLNSNSSFKILVKEKNNVKEDSRFVQRLKESRRPTLTKGTSGRAENLGDITPDNRKIGTERDDPRANLRPRKDPNGRGHSGGAWSGVYSTEETKTTVQKFSQPKESNFQKDADKIRRLRYGDKSNTKQGFSRPSGVGPEYDTRAGGQGAAAGAGLGDQTFREDSIGPMASNADVINFAGTAGGPKANPLDSNYQVQNKRVSKFRKKLKEWNGFQNDTESGVGGTLGGSDNKENMENPKGKVGYTYSIIKKKKDGVKK